MSKDQQHDLTPEPPEEAGVDDKDPALMQVEGARVLANEARPQLEDAGFETGEVIDWATTYIAEEGSGDVESFITWIERRETRSKPTKTS
ncbi:MAG: hypothetical protein WAN34_07555 [Acidimicrobiia bacterium]